MNTPRNGHTRGTGPVRPGDLTGQRFAQNQARIEAEKRVRENPPVDIEAVRHTAYEAGREAGFSEGVRWVQDHYDVFEPEDEDETIGTSHE